MGANTSYQNSFSRTIVYKIVRDAIVPALPDNNPVTMFVNLAAMMDVIVDNLITETDIFRARAVATD